MNFYFETKTDIAKEKMADTSSLAMFHLTQILEKATSQKKRKLRMKFYTIYAEYIKNCTLTET